MTDRGVSKRRPYVALGYADIRLGRDLKGSAFLLYCYLSLRVGTNSGAWPSYERISTDTGLAPATISKGLRQLVDYGVLQVERRRSEGRQTSNFYTLLDPPDTSETEVNGTTQTSETEVSPQLPPEPPSTSGSEVKNGPRVAPDTSEPEVGVNGTTQTSETEEEETTGLRPEEASDIAPAARVRPRDPLFEAVAEAWLGKPYPELQLTRSQRGNVNACVVQLREIKACPEAVPREWQRLRSMFDHPTPAALAKHWNTNGTGPKRKETPVDIAQRRIISREQSRRAGRDAGRSDDRPQWDERLRDRALGADVPRLPDGRA